MRTIAILLHKSCWYGWVADRGAFIERNSYFSAGAGPEECERLSNSEEDFSLILVMRLPLRITLRALSVQCGMQRAALRFFFFLDFFVLGEYI